MQFRDGDIILDVEEVQLLAFAFMSEVENTYPASEFISGLNEIQAEAEEHIQKSHFKRRPKDGVHLRPKY